MATWTLDNAHSEIEFKVKHMMISTVKGVFQNFTVNVNSDSERLDTASVTAEIDVNSIFTKNEQRDQHLKSEDFFDVSKHPNITFTSTQVKNVSGNDYQITGDVTIKNITKSITFDVEFGGIGKDPWGNQKAGYTVTGKINRDDFGLNWNAALETGGVMVSTDVKFQADLQFIIA